MYLAEIKMVVQTTLMVRNAIFWNVTLCVCRENQRFRGTYHLHHQGQKNQ
jgi:hypothetical protein